MGRITEPWMLVFYFLFSGLLSILLDSAAHENNKFYVWATSRAGQVWIAGLTTWGAVFWAICISVAIFGFCVFDREVGK
ncbi:MAG: hypothetical protein ACXABY_30625 [Candidatus Thorarchaeota archaeon]|jgi:hypothetical protein